MPAITTLLHGLDHWLEPWRRQVWEAIYLGHNQRCEEALCELDKALEGLPSYLDSEAAQLYAEMLRFEARDNFTDDLAARTELRRNAADQLSRSVGSLIARAMQARILLTIRCLAHHLGMSQITRAEVDDYLDLVPDEDRDHQCLSYLAFWAYDVKDKEILDYCYCQFLTDPFTFMIDFSRQRIRVMRALVSGDCAAEELTQLIRLVPHQTHWKWIESHIKPECRQRGLWTEDIEQHLRSRHLELTREGPHIPSRSEPVGFQLNF